MLSSLYCQQVSAFRQAVTLPDWDTILTDGSAAQAIAQELQQTFQQTLGNLETASLEASAAQGWRSVLVEIDKQLRLLAMDSLFLATARQPETRAHRCQHMRDRLTLLTRYCDRLIAQVDPHE